MTPHPNMKCHNGCHKCIALNLVNAGGSFRRLSVTFPTVELYNNVILLVPKNVVGMALSGEAMELKLFSEILLID